MVGPKSESQSHIREQAHRALDELLRRRYERWPDSPPSDLEMIEPAFMAQLWKIRFHEPVDIKLFTTEFAGIPVLLSYAGYMDPATNTIAVARNLRLEVRRFTAAHELGHYVLHRDMGVLFRDLPLSGAEAQDRHRAPEEKEADIFAAEFLMPEPIVRREFFSYFGVKSFVGVKLGEDTAFRLTTPFRKVTLNKLEQRERRYFSLLLADSRPWGNGDGRELLSTLSERFRVSDSAMAIQLESLGLV